MLDKSQFTNMRAVCVGILNLDGAEGRPQSKLLMK